MFPKFYSATAFTSGGTNSVTMPTLTNAVMVVIVNTQSSSTPSVTYNGSAFTFPYAPANDTSAGIFNPWVGYLVAPTTGAHNLVSPAVYTDLAIFSDVDQSTPFVSNGTTHTTGGSQIATPDTNNLNPTAFDNSVLIKSSYESTVSGKTFSDGTGEKGRVMVTGGAGSPRWSFKVTQTAGNYSVSTPWTGGGTTPAALQIIELKGAANTDAAYGLVYNYKLDESSGTAVDSISALNLTNTSVTYGAAKINNGAVFNASASLVSSSNTGISGVMPRSINCWVKYTTSPATPGVVGWGAQSSNGDSFLMLLLSDQLYFGGQSADISGSGSALNDNNWHMLTITYDGINVRLYTDNVAGNTGTPAISTTDTHLFVGERPDASNKFTGTIDEITIWNRALTVSDIAALYNSGAGLQYSKNFSATPVTGSYSLSGNVMSTLLSIGNAIFAVGSYILTGLGLTTSRVDKWTPSTKGSASFSSINKNSATFSTQNKNTAVFTPTNQS